MAQTQERQAELIHEEDADQTSSASFTEHAGSDLSEDERCLYCGQLFPYHALGFHSESHTGHGAESEGPTSKSRLPPTAEKQKGQRVFNSEISYDKRQIPNVKTEGGGLGKTQSIEPMDTGPERTLIPRRVIPEERITEHPENVDFSGKTGKWEYAYEQLPNGNLHIRVLTIESGEYNDPLRGSLSVEQLDAEPAYEAISYVWGSSEGSYQIQLRQGASYVPIDITQNLNLALRRLRQSSQDKRLWTDAICINQRDDHEKAVQVRAMTQIYRTGQAVWIYLGEPGDSTQEALDLLQEIYEASKKTAPEDTRLPDDWILDNCLPRSFEHLAWEPLKTFFRRPWFRRKWTIQEAVVASRAIFCCGNWTAEWDFIEVIHHAIDKYGLAVYDYTTYGKPDMAKELQQGLAQLRSLIVTKKRRKENLDEQLMDLVYRFQASRAKVARDHLFALLGLAADAGDKALDPDYEKSDADIMEQYARYFLAQKGNLEVLYRAGDHGHRLLAPSWIPNWYGAHEDFSFEYAEGPWNPLRRPSFCNVAPGTTMQLIESPEPGVLGIKGIHIDSIRNVASPYSASTPMTKKYIEELKRSHAEESDAIMSSIRSYPTGEDPDEVHWRTLICNVALDLTKPPPEYSSSYQAWRRTLVPEALLPTDDWKTLVPEALLPTDDWKHARIFSEVINRYHSDKLFGSTTNGYVGMFPTTARAEDQVWVLLGGEFPFVLRKTRPTGHHQLIGQCYIHGIMEGQLDLKNDIIKDVYLGGPYERGSSAFSQSY